MADTKKPSKKDGASKLAKASKKGEVELKEEELGRISGGFVYQIVNKQK